MRISHSRSATKSQTHRIAEGSRVSSDTSALRQRRHNADDDFVLPGGPIFAQRRKAFERPVTLAGSLMQPGRKELHANPGRLDLAHCLPRRLAQ
ncbi:hypothetical protein A9K66_17835 [Mesorhizobium sp. AA23]|nr:hypothetical protein A9K66_17835 [Mesorhizobium sp. AA23]